MTGRRRQDVYDREGLAERRKPVEQQGPAVFQIHPGALTTAPQRHN